MKTNIYPFLLSSNQTFFHKEEEEENRNLKFYCDVSVRKKLWKNIFNAI